MNWYKKAQSRIRLWLDDERDPKNHKIQELFGAKGNEIWVKTAQEAIGYIENSEYEIEHISFDHDLGDPNTNGDGYDVAKLIEQKAYFNEIKPFSWDVHSQNPTGAKNISDAMNNADKYWRKNELV